MDLADVLGQSAENALREGDPQRAEQFAREALALLRRTYGGDSWVTANARKRIGRCLALQGRYEEAEPLLLESYPPLASALGVADGHTCDARSYLIELYRAWGRPESARPYTEETIALSRSRAADPNASASVLHRHAELLLACEPADLRDPGEALEAARQALALSGGADLRILATLAQAYFLTGDTPRAIETQKEALSLAPPDSPERARLEETPAELEATAEAEWVLGGRYLVQRIQGGATEWMPRRYEGFNVFGYDVYRERYLYLNLDNYTTAMHLYEGTADERGGITFLGSFADPAMGQKSAKATIEILSRDEFHYRDYEIGPEGEYASVEVIYRRE